MPRCVNLFEFEKYSWSSSPELNGIDKEAFSDDLERVLDKIWLDRKRYIPAESLYYISSSEKQRFIDFRKNEIVPRNWLGTIHFKSNNDEFIINLLPKIFYKENHIYTAKETDSIFAHLLWWLSGSDKQHYSSMESSLDSMESDFLEILIWIFSSHTHEVLTTTSYNYYETVCEDVETVKGQIDFNRYAQNYGYGRGHKLFCVFDSLQYDNQFNRIVKYVCTILKSITRNPDTTGKKLDEILFILDEVDYMQVTPEDCDKVVLNPIYTEFRTILDHCRMFLSSLSIYKWKDEYSVFALLMPSEKIFENFIFSVLKNNAKSPIRKVSRDKPDNARTYLVRQAPEKEARKYKLINDIVVKLEDNSFVLLDTKYKRIFNLKEDTEVWEDDYKINQADIYQMVSYALGSGVSDIGLIYPELPFHPSVPDLPVYEILDEFNRDRIIRIHLFKVSIVHRDILSVDIKGKLENIFRDTTHKLVDELNSIVIKTTRQKLY
jgi:5-methylcytosine-specific restriction enzyme subunit McrC